MVTGDNEQFGLGKLPASAIVELRLDQRVSDLPSVFTELNTLAEREVIGDYAIGGGYAKIYYGIPCFTNDLDILVILGNDKDFHNLYSYYREQGNRIEREYIYIADTAVQFFPDFIHPLFHEAIKEAQQIEVNGVPSKVVSVEYLITLLLKAFRPKDKIHILELYGSADIPKLKEILRRFDDGQQLLSKRLKEVLGDLQKDTRSKR